MMTMATAAPLALLLLTGACVLAGDNATADGAGDAGDAGDAAGRLPTLYEYYKAGGVTAGLEAETSVFRLNGREIRIHSGALHYFRVHPAYWRDRLRKMRACGLNAVETYVPWNLHNPAPGVFDFGEGTKPWSSWLDVASFIRVAQEEDLLVFVRPGPYICAEWEFGGLPSWLLRDPNMAVRTSYSGYIEAVRAFFGALLPRLAPLHWLNGGPIVAVQLENEYGAFQVDDKPYLALLKTLLENAGLPGLFFTSDSPAATADKGALPGVLQTANFQSNPGLELGALQQLQPGKPFMVMEYWTGWFDHWTEEHHTRPSDDFGSVLRKILEWPSSVNMYMFHGGSNWGFMNGANVKTSFPRYQPDVTSYDYDAPLTENGDYTDKWNVSKSLLAEFQPVQTLLPEAPSRMPRRVFESVAISRKLTLGALAQQVPSNLRVQGEQVLPMELLEVNNGAGQSFGFTLYRRASTSIPVNTTLTVRGHVHDLAIVLVDGQRATPVLQTPNQFLDFGYWEKVNASLRLPEPLTGNVRLLDILVENWGRVNYGVPRNFRQFKGLVSGPVELNGTPLSNWEMLALQFDADWLQSLQDWEQSVEYGELSTPTMFHAFLDVIEPIDTWLDMRGWGKGAVFVNGFPLGRYFHLGPTHTIYLPAPLLQQGQNEILIFELFETPGELRFSKRPILGNN